MLTFAELLKKRRSIREYTDEKVNLVVLDEILRDTCQAPSAMNQQPWKFIIIQDRNLMERISDESKKNLLRELENNPNSRLKKYEAMLRQRFNVFYNAPCLVLIVGKNEQEFFQRDCGLAAVYFMFAATARGLGTCWIGLGEHIQDEALKKEIGLPEGHEIAAAIIIGYPQMIQEPSVRQPVILKKIV